MKVIGIIPARGGSKGVPRKNLRTLGGKPLIAHTIEAARAAQALSRVVVSTDDEEIAAVARRCGAEVPFLRPPEHATDSARAIDVMRHAMNALERADAYMMLQPTTPFRRASDIDGAIALLEKSGAESVISVVSVGGHHPARMKYLQGDRLMDPPFCEAVENQPRQELTPMYLRNGAIYLTRASVLAGGSFKGRDCRAWQMPEELSVNIDTELDLRWAEMLLATR